MRSFNHEVTVTVDGEPLTLCIDFAALDAIEGLIDAPFNTLLKQLNLGEDLKDGTVVRMVWALLRRHHASVSLDEAAQLALGPSSLAIGAAIQGLLESAFPVADAGKAKEARPPKPRGASRAS